MSGAAPLPSRDLDPDEIVALRIDLAAAFRIAVRFGWHESVGNHFSAAISADGQRFLMNPRWRHFGDMRASDLLLLDAQDDAVMIRPGAPDASAWTVHGTIHRRRPDVRVILHLHTPYATALATLADPALLPIDNNTARFYGRLAIDNDFGGIADDAAEGERFATQLGDKTCLLMASHGLTVTAATVAEAFEDLYFFEKAAKTLLIAQGSGQKLRVLSDDVAARTAAGWLPYRGMAYAHFDYLKRRLDREEPDYRE